MAGHGELAREGGDGEEGDGGEAGALGRQGVMGRGAGLASYSLPTAAVHSLFYPLFEGQHA
jgi:hypothetical protein